MANALPRQREVFVLIVAFVWTAILVGKLARCQEISTGTYSEFESSSSVTVVTLAGS